MSFQPCFAHYTGIVTMPRGRVRDTTGTIRETHQN